MIGDADYLGAEALIASEAALMALVAASEAAFIALVATDEAAVSTAEATAEAASAAAGATGGGTGAGVSSFLPQADKATAANSVASTSDFFMCILSL